MHYRNSTNINIRKMNIISFCIRLNIHSFFLGGSSLSSFVSIFNALVRFFKDDCGNNSGEDSGDGSSDDSNDGFGDDCEDDSGDGFSFNLFFLTVSHALLTMKLWFISRCSTYHLTS